MMLSDNDLAILTLRMGIDFRYKRRIQRPAYSDIKYEAHSLSVLFRYIRKDKIKVSVYINKVFPHTAEWTGLEKYLTDTYQFPEKATFYNRNWSEYIYILDEQFVKALFTYLTISPITPNTKTKLDLFKNLDKVFGIATGTKDGIWIKPGDLKGIFEELLYKENVYPKLTRINFDKDYTLICFNDKIAYEKGKEILKNIILEDDCNNFKFKVKTPIDFWLEVFTKAYITKSRALYHFNYSIQHNIRPNFDIIHQIKSITI